MFGCKLGNIVTVYLKIATLDAHGVAFFHGLRRGHFGKGLKIMRNTRKPHIFAKDGHSIFCCNK
jgi:hypothetical protein